MFKYLLWSGLTLFGAAAALWDWRVFRRPWLGLALLAAFAAGYGLTFLATSDADAALFLRGVFVAVCAAFALTAYGIVAFVWVVGGQIGRLRKARSS